MSCIHKRSPTGVSAAAQRRRRAGVAKRRAGAEVRAATSRWRAPLSSRRASPSAALSVRWAALRYAPVYFMFPSPNGECPTSVTDRLWHSTTPPCAFFRVAFRSVRRVRRLRAIRAGVGGSSRVYLCCRFGVVNICVVRTITVLSVRSSRVDIFNDRRLFAKVSEILILRILFNWRDVCLISRYVAIVSSICSGTSGIVYNVATYVVGHEDSFLFVSHVKFCIIIWACTS